MTILRYHGNTDWNILRTEKDDLKRDFTFGFELEVCKSQNTESNMTPLELSNIIDDKWPKIFVCERDGSIGEGVEIISHPMTWNYFYDHQDIFKELLELCIENGFDSHKQNKCGLHVHVGRKVFNLNTAESVRCEKYIITNINYILERFSDELLKFSRRTKNSLSRWCAFRDQKITLENGASFINKDNIKKQDHKNSERYLALNLNNEKTIEFRFLRGTLKYETFFISMNLIKNIVMQSMVSENTIDFKSLIMLGLNDDEKEYAIEYCQKRNIEFSEDVIHLEETEKKKQKIYTKEQLLESLCEDE